MAVRIVENCCSPLFLDFVRHQVEQSDRWNFKYPMNTSFDEKHAKLEIIGGQGAPDQRLAGIAMSLMIQIYEMASDIITPNIMFCGASIKDKYRKDNLHTDHNDDPRHKNFIKVLGILNSDWQDSWGGGFEHGGEVYPVRPTDFIIFDSKIEHRAADILVDKKRIAIDFTMKGQHHDFALGEGERYNVNNY